MRAVRVLVILALAGGVAWVPDPASAQAVRQFHCSNFFGVVFHPAQLTQVDPNAQGVFGSVVGVPSNVSCTGDLVGTAGISGFSRGCTPVGNEAVCPARIGTAPDMAPVYTTVNTSGVVSLFSSTHAEAVLTPDPGTGLRWADDPGLSRGLVTCTISADIVGSPAGALLGRIVHTCRGANETQATTFTGTTSLGLVVLLGPAGNLVTSSEPGYTDLCPDPLVTLNPDDLQCFRSVLLVGAWNATDNGVF